MSMLFYTSFIKALKMLSRTCKPFRKYGPATVSPLRSNKVSNFSIGVGSWKRLMPLKEHGQNRKNDNEAAKYKFSSEHWVVSRNLHRPIALGQWDFFAVNLKKGGLTMKNIKQTSIIISARLSFAFRFFPLGE